jgi:cell division protein FtsN
MSRSVRKNGASRIKREPAVREKSSHPAFFAGLLIGALVMYFLPPMLSGTKIEKIAKAPEVVEKKAIEELTFDFYTLLKDNEILIDQDQDSHTSAEQNKNTEYLLQVASFKNLEDAENLKVELLLMNLSANSETVTNKNGEIFHRVLVGPFPNTSKMASARARLAQNNMESLLLKRFQKNKH